MKKILVAEDELDFQSVLRLRLEAAGYEVIPAANGREGLQKALRIVPDLIITDVLMPVMDGFLFYKELKRNTTTAKIPVLILTSRSKMEDSFKVMGADAFLAKPFEAEQLLKQVNLLLSPPCQENVFSGRRILIGGADQEIVSVMALLLTGRGCVCETVDAGSQILSRALAFKPHLCLLDVFLEDVLTAEIIGMLRRVPGLASAPIVTYSFYRVAELGSEDIQQRAMSVDARKADCLAAGATEYIDRFNDRTFLSTMERFLR